MEKLNSGRKNINDFIRECKRQDYMNIREKAKQNSTSFRYNLIKFYKNKEKITDAEIFKPTILHNAAAVIAFHNHPSGDSTPSKEDLEFTNRLVEIGELLEIQFLIT